MRRACRLILRRGCRLFGVFTWCWPNGWWMALEFNPDLFERRTAERMLEFLMAMIEFAISNPDARLSSLVLPVRDRIAPPKSIDGFAAIGASRPPPSAPPSVEPTDAETRMVAIWQDVLQVKSIRDAYLLAFFDTYVRNRPSPLLTQSPSPFRDVEVLKANEYWLKEAAESTIQSSAGSN
jgi:hypothetical protein